MKKFLRWFALGLLCALIVIQFFPVDRSNPPVQGDIGAPADVQAILRRSCYDCHSNEARWPWYGYVAPASFLVEHDIEEGREHLNFSVWNTYPEKRRLHKLEEILEETEEGAMPPGNYVFMHGDAELSQSDIAAIRAWITPQLPAGKGTAAGAEGGSEGEKREGGL